MRSNLDWTYDSNGSWKGLDKLVKDLHDHGQHYNILIVSNHYLALDWLKDIRTYFMA